MGSHKRWDHLSPAVSQGRQSIFLFYSLFSGFRVLLREENRRENCGGIGAYSYTWQNCVDDSADEHVFCRPDRISQVFKSFFPHHKAVVNEGQGGGRSLLLKACYCKGNVK